MTEQICANCGKPNREGESYCFSCGHILPAGLKAAATHSLPDDSEIKPQLRWGTAYFGEETILQLHLRSPEGVIETTFKDECVLGRATKDSAPDVDLKPYEGERPGVSRLHAKLKRESATIMVQDLGSRNGTFLNGERLVPYQPRVLRNGDELRLGHLVLRVSFMRSPHPGMGK
jgi:hypothetical protein